MLRVRTLLQQHWPILALLTFFAILYSTAIGSYAMFMWDEAEYASLARSVANGHGFAIGGVPKPLRPPMLPLAGAATMLLAREQFDDTVLRATEIPFALLALVCTYAFTTLAWDRTTGFIAAALLGVMPLFWISVPFFLSEVPFLGFFAAAFWFFHFGLYRDRRFFLWSWIALALAMLTRYNAVLFLPLALLVIPLAWWLGGPAARQRMFSRSFLLSPLAALLVFLPWLIHQYVTFGDPLAGFQVASQQLRLYVPDVSMPWYFYFEHIAGFLSLPIAVLCLAGVAWAFWKRDFFALNNVMAAALILVWFSFYRYKEDRFISEALPFLAVLAAVPLARMTLSLRSMPRFAILAAVLAGLLLLNFRVAGRVFQRAEVLGYPSFLDAMAFLRGHAGADEIVLGANYPQISWYSGLRAYDFPKDEASFPAALKGSNWVVITNFERGQRPYVSKLAEGMPADAALTTAFQDSRYFTILIRSSRLLEMLRQ